MSHKEIIRAYRELGSVEEVAKRLQLEPIAVSYVVNAMELRELYRRKGSQLAHSDEYLHECLRLAAAVHGEPLTVTGYRQIARELGLATDLTITKRFDTFEAGCQGAGVKANPAVGVRSWAITPQQCLDALREYRSVTGRIPSYQRYIRWAQENGKPSGPTVRMKWKTWGNALREAFDE